MRTSKNIFFAQCQKFKWSMGLETRITRTPKHSFGIITVSRHHGRWLMGPHHVHSSCRIPNLTWKVAWICCGYSLLGQDPLWSTPNLCKMWLLAKTLTSYPKMFPNMATMSRPTTMSQKFQTFPCLFPGSIPSGLLDPRAEQHGQVKACCDYSFRAWENGSGIWSQWISWEVHWKITTDQAEFWRLVYGKLMNMAHFDDESPSKMIIFCIAKLLFIRMWRGCLGLGLGGRKFHEGWREMGMGWGDGVWGCSRIS